MGPNQLIKTSDWAPDTTQKTKFFLSRVQLWIRSWTQKKNEVEKTKFWGRRTLRVCLSTTSKQTPPTSSTHSTISPSLDNDASNRHKRWHNCLRIALSLAILYHVSQETFIYRWNEASCLLTCPKGPKMARSERHVLHRRCDKFDFDALTSRNTQIEWHTTDINYIKSNHIKFKIVF